MISTLVVVVHTFVSVFCMHVYCYNYESYSATASVDAPTLSLTRVDMPTSSVMTSLVSPAPVVTTSVIPSPTPLSGEQEYLMLCYVY